MKKNPLLLSCVVVFFMVIFFLLWLTVRPPEYPSNVTVSFLSPTPTPVKPNDVSSIPGSVTKTITPDETHPSQQSTRNMNRQAAENPGSISPVLLVQDAFSEPIQTGLISFNGEDHPFQNGRFQFSTPVHNTIIVSASAEGYFPARATVSFATSTQDTIILEYVSNLELRVYDQESGNPCPDARIRLWKSGVPKRPVETVCHFFNARSGSINGQSMELVYTGDNAIVIPGMQSVNPIYTSPNTDGYLLNPLKGDRIVCFGNCSWYPGISPLYSPRDISYLHNFYLSLRNSLSSRLRIWDAMSLSHPSQVASQSSLKEFYEKCEIERDSDNRAFMLVRFPPLLHSGELILEGQTDAKGIFQIRNLPPALYYAQADKGSAQSVILPLHPACGGGELTLMDGSQVKIFVYRKGIDQSNAIRSVVSDAQITLRPLFGGAGLYSGQADASYGGLELPSVAYGEYLLSVRSEEGTHEEKVSIQEPYEVFLIELDNWERYSISGKVFERDNGNPVPGYQLELRGNMGDRLAVEKTDADGRYVFANVPPGLYDIVFHFDPENIETLNFLPYSEEISTNFLGYSRMFNKQFTTNFIEYRVNVEDRDLQEVDISVIRIVKTQFSGQVISQEGTPVPDLFVQASYRNVAHQNSTLSRLQTIPDDPRTDSSGNFSFSVCSNRLGQAEQFVFQLLAQKGVMIPGRWAKSVQDPLLSAYVPETMAVSQQGSLEVEGYIGDTFKSLLITVKQTEPHTVWCTVHLEDGDTYNSGPLVYQNQKSLHAERTGDNTFRIENVAEGMLDIHLGSSLLQTVITPYESKSIYKYRSEKLEIQIPADEPNIYVDVMMKRVGFFFGTVKDENQNPIMDAIVDARESHGENRLVAQGTTGRNGEFFIGQFGQITLDQEYILQVNKGPEIVKRIGPIAPSQEEITIQIP